MEKEIIKKQRKPLSSKIRFEVFKRDSFTCRYCGQNAPLVVLQVDHILPIAKDGTDDIMNLITSCITCNQGKGARKLDEHQVLTKSFEQAKLINEKREQLHMMMQWRQELAAFSEEQTDFIEKYWHSFTQYGLTSSGRNEIKRVFKKHSAEQILNAIDTVIDQYLKYDDKDRVLKETAEKAFEKISGVLAMQKKLKKNPHLLDLMYIRGILRNRLSYINEKQIMPLLNEAIAHKICVDDLKEVALSATSWTNFKNQVDDMVIDSGSKQDENTRVLTKQLDSRTELIGYATSVSMKLIEDYEIEEDYADTISDALITYCEPFFKYLEELEPEIDEDRTIDDVLRDFINSNYFETPENRSAYYRNEIPRNLEDLNRHLYTALGKNIPFLFISSNRVFILRFLTYKQHDSFCKALHAIKDEEGRTYLDRIVQINNLSPVSILSAICIGVVHVITDEFTRHNLSISSDQLKKIFRYYKPETLLNWLNIWMSVRDEKTNKALYEYEKNRQYTWTNFITGLQQTMPLDENLLIVPGSEITYMKLFEGVEEPFVAYLRNEYGIVKVVKVKNWKCYLKLIN